MNSQDYRNLQEAYLDVYEQEEILDEAITSEKGKAKAAEMIAARSTPSGRAKSGQGANVAQIRQIRGSGRGYFDREGLGGTPMTPTMAKNPIRKQNYTGTGNKAARRAGTYQEEVEIFDTVLEFLYVEGYAETLEEAEWLMANVIDEEAIDIVIGEASVTDDRVRRNQKTFGSNYTPPRDWDQSANRGKGAVLNAKQKEKQRRKGLRQEEYMDEAQEARNNPEKYEREQSKKSAPVRGERTPMPPRGDKRREDFEKWYAANVR